MYKIKALLIFFMLGILLNNCGYTPRYSSNEKVNFSIQINNVSGDREFNNLIKSELNRYNKNTEKTFVVDYDSKYEKSISAKDSAGNTKEYELKIKINFLVKTNGSERKIVMKETFKIKKMEDAFEESNYEKTIKRNFANLISERLIFQISQM